MTARRPSKRRGRHLTGPSHRVRSAQRKNELILPACLLIASTVVALIFVPSMLREQPSSDASTTDSLKASRTEGRVLVEAPADEGRGASSRSSLESGSARDEAPKNVADVPGSEKFDDDAEILDLRDMARRVKERQAKRDAESRSLEEDIAESLAYLDGDGESVDEVDDVDGERVPKNGGVTPKAAKPAGPPNLFTLSLTGTLGKSALAVGDAQSWARLGYFMQHESPRSHYLVYPGGGIPLSVPKGQTEIAPTRGPGPLGDVDRPAYRIVIHGASKAGKGISFYGSQLASKFTCTIACRIERLSRGRYVKISEFRVTENSTPAKIQGTQEQYLRKVYDVTFDKLMRRLKSEAPFK